MCPSLLATNFPGFLCSSTPTKTRARSAFQLREMHLGLTHRARKAIKQVALREQPRPVFYRRVNRGIRVHAIFRPASTRQI